MAVLDEKRFKKERAKFLAMGPQAGIVSPKLFGVLPLKRVIPMDVHSVLDYQHAAAAAAVGMIGGEEAGAAGTLLGLSGVGVALLTDYRLSVAKLIPIEVHEIIDYVWSVAAIAAPFIFGYAKKKPLTTLAHVAIGATQLVASLMTDYRSQRNVHWNGKKLASPVLN